ncbi:MAG: hypothetical protein BAJALOKI1v1_860014 [Promethearchaeota archaeon]|nr:MAG: hypothetical protein BAJALOKI1v1_860014 [Candidatus Lokiarchaeota archaeon]
MGSSVIPTSARRIKARIQWNVLAMEKPSKNKPTYRNSIFFTSKYFFRKSAVKISVSVKYITKKMNNIISESSNDTILIHPFIYFFFCCIILLHKILNKNH